VFPAAAAAAAVVVVVVVVAILVIGLDSLRERIPPWDGDGADCAMAAVIAADVSRPLLAAGTFLAAGTLSADGRSSFVLCRDAGMHPIPFSLPI
jgi:hypothetical protein